MLPMRETTLDSRATSNGKLYHQTKLLTSAADRSLTVPLYGERRHRVKQGQLVTSMQRFRGNTVFAIYSRFMRWEMLK